jgi:hypothetical protein
LVTVDHIPVLYTLPLTLSFDSSSKKPHWKIGN